MSTSIENGYILDPLERIIKLGKELSVDANYSAIISKPDGRYTLTVIIKSGAGARDESHEIDLGVKIPPDTNAKVAEDNTIRKSVTINVNP